MNPSTHLPPQSIDTEESIIASCLLIPADVEKAVDILSPQDFYRTAHQKIFHAVADISNSGGKVDLTSLSEALKRKNQLDECGGAVYLAKIIDTAPIVSNIEKYCEIIKALAVKRLLISECSNISGQCFDYSVSSVELLDQAQQMITKAESGNMEEQPVLAGDLCMGLIQQYEKVNESKTGITGLQTGFNKLDKITGGLQKTDLVILAARPGMGKTAFALDLAKSFCEYQHPVLFESIEMSKEQLTGRMASKISGVDSVKLRTGGITQSEWSRIMDSMDVITDMPLYIDSPKNNDFDSIRRKIRRAKRERGIAVVVIDYLQLMTRRGDFNGRKDLEIGSITRDLKHLAADLEIPVVLLSQLNRELEKRSDKRPVLSDLRESGAIEQDADLILFLYRDEVYNKDEHNPLKGTGELIISKHRHGPTGKFQMVWDEKTATYRNIINVDGYQNWQDRSN